jgi:hypothetical protein
MLGNRPALSFQSFGDSKFAFNSFQKSVVLVFSRTVGPSIFLNFSLGIC